MTTRRLSPHLFPTRLAALLLALGAATPGAVQAGQFLDFCSARRGGETEQLYVDGRIAEKFDWRRDCVQHVMIEAVAPEDAVEFNLVVSMLIARPGDEARGQLWMTFDAKRLRKITSDILTVKPVGWSQAVPTPDEEPDVDNEGSIMLPPDTQKFLRRHLDQAADGVELDIPIASQSWPRKR